MNWGAVTREAEWEERRGAHIREVAREDLSTQVTKARWQGAGQRQSIPAGERGPEAGISLLLWRRLHVYRSC